MAPQARHLSLERPACAWAQRESVRVHRVRQVDHVSIAVRYHLRLTALLVPHQEVALSSKGQRRKSCALGPACFAVAMIADRILAVLVLLGSMELKVVPSTSLTRTVIGLSWSHTNVFGGEPPLTL